MRTLLLCLALVPCTLFGQVLIKSEPASPLVEHRNSDQFLNFDFALQNTSPDTLRLHELIVRVFDSAGKIVLEKTVNSDGLRPGIDLVSNTVFKPSETENIFNPFFRFASDIPVARLDYEFRFLREDSASTAEANRHRLPMDVDLVEHLTVTPRDYQTRTALRLPLRGRLLVWEGHDFFAHHRRVPLDSAKSKSVGIAGANSNRYAVDLVLVDNNGAMFRHQPYNKTDYYSYGQPIYAPAAGTVLRSRNNIPDNEFQGKTIRYPKLSAEDDDGLGNYVILDHGDGEYSFLPHMKPGSVRVKGGDHVAQGQLLGDVGFSGDAIFPHVHYALISGPDVHTGEGIPAYFDSLNRLLGSKAIHSDHVALETGDIIEDAK